MHALRMKYTVNCRLSRDLLVVSGVRGVRLGESTTSLVFVVKVINALLAVCCAVKYRRSFLKPCKLSALERR